jgi:TonB family protein
MSRAVLIALTCVCAAEAQNVLPPVPLAQCRQPEYTEEARLAHLSGTVTVSLTVTDSGRPTDIHVVTPVGFGLDESAVACMRQSRYSPALKDGKPVPFKIEIPLAFEQHWDSDWHLGAAAFGTPAGASRPQLVKTKFPAATGDHRSGSVCLHLTVGKDGVPHGIHVSPSQDAGLERDAAGIVGDWRFKPGTQGRQAIDIPATLTLVHGTVPHPVTVARHRP